METLILRKSGDVFEIEYPGNGFTHELTVGEVLHDVVRFLLEKDSREFFYPASCISHHVFYDEV